MSAIQSILETYKTINLDQMEQVFFMNRTDTKYVFPIQILETLFMELRPDFKVLEVDNKRISDYETLYFDSSDFAFFYQHQHGKMPRNKIRIRKYLSNGLMFLEHKLKNNKERTIKSRIKIKKIPEDITSKLMELLGENNPILLTKLIPTIWVNYSRITLVNNDLTMRMTIDIDLHYKANNEIKRMDEIAILELKRDKSKATDMEKLLHQHKIFPMSFSKYCHGLTEIEHSLKINNFKNRKHKLEAILKKQRTNRINSTLNI